MAMGYRQLYTGLVFLDVLADVLPQLVVLVRAVADHVGDEHQQEVEIVVAVWKKEEIVFIYDKYNNV